MTTTTHFPKFGSKLSRVVRAAFSSAGYGIAGRQWILRIFFGRGAGYCTWISRRWGLCVRHATFYVARNCYRPETVNTGRQIRPLLVGFTFNGNATPYVNG